MASKVTEQVAIKCCKLLVGYRIDDIETFFDTEVAHIRSILSSQTSELQTKVINIRSREKDSVFSSKSMELSDG